MGTLQTAIGTYHRSESGGKGSNSRTNILRELDQCFSNSTRIYRLAAFLSVFEFVLAKSALLGLGILN